MHTVIVGGGFGGVKTALEIAKRSKREITLISNSRNFQYYPALYSTATGHSYRESWVPLSEIFKEYPQVKLIDDNAVSIDCGQKTLTGRKKVYQFDEIVLALGSVTTYFGIEGLDTFSFGIKSESEIRRLQKHLIDDMGDGVEDEIKYVIIGAGPTGVELAGALGEYIHILRDHFDIPKKSVDITLIEAAPRVLPRSSEKASRIVEKRLKKLGVNVETNKKVEKATATELIVNGEPLKTQTVIWTSGVANSPFYAENKSQFSLDARGHVVVDKFMQACQDIYVIGDNATTPYAGLAQTALHDAQFVARRIATGSPVKYRPVQPPSVVPVGHNWAIVEWKKFRLYGVLGGWIRRAADMIGYHDVLPFGWAIDSWRAGKKREMTLPDEIRVR